jgi:MarR family transcriptional regulator, transcriptional regulator for hemolysin
MAFAADGHLSFDLLMAEVSGLYASHFRRNARGVELTPLQCKLLVLLSRNEGISQARLAQLMDSDPMTVVRMLDSIQADAWIERCPDPDDRRAHRLYLRAAAMPTLNRMWKIVDQSRQQALGALSELEREHLVDLLGRVHDTLLRLEPRRETEYGRHSG